MAPPGLVDSGVAIAYRERMTAGDVRLPMAPTEEDWARLMPADRRLVADSLPADLGLLPTDRKSVV